MDHGKIGLLIIDENDSLHNHNPYDYEWFAGAEDENYQFPLTLITSSGVVRTINDGQIAHVVWEPDPGYYWYSGSARYSPVGGGDYIALCEPGYYGGDDIFTVPENAEYIQINAFYKPKEYTVVTDASVDHGTISGTVTDAKGNTRTFEGTACTDETVNLTFTPEDGYELRTDSVEIYWMDKYDEHYSVDDAEVNYETGKATFTMGSWGDVHVEAVFQKTEEATHKVILSKTNDGEGNASVDKEWAAPGEMVTVTLTPGANSVYTPVSISAGSDLTGNPDSTVPGIGEEGTVTFTMPAEDVTVSHGFMDAIRDITVGSAVALANGKVNINDVEASDQISVPAGTEVSVSISPNSGHKIKNAGITEKPAQTAPADLQETGEGSYKFTAASLTWDEYENAATSVSYDVSPIFTIDASFVPHAELVLGTSPLGNHPNDVDACSILWYGGREWYVVAHDGAGNSAMTTSSVGAVSVLQRYIHNGQKITEFDPYEYNPDGNDKSSFSTTGDTFYINSNVRTHLNKYLYGGEYQLFSEEETVAIKKRNLGSGMANETLWVMSSEEANAVPDDMRLISWTRHWLRDRKKRSYPREEGQWEVCNVGPLGGVSSLGVDKLGNELGVRPAFNLDMDAVLFTSDINKGKASGTVGPNALKEVGLDSGREVKVTLKDSDYEITVENVEFENDVFTIDYEAGKYGENDYISAFILNEDETLTHYGRVAKPSEAKGTLTINVKGIYEEGDKLYLINEQYNGGTITDLASEPVEIEKPKFYSVTIHWSSMDGDDLEDAIVIENVREGKSLAAAIEDAGYNLMEPLFSKDGYWH